MKSLIIIILTFCFTLTGFSQSLKETTADKYFDLLAFIKAVDYYKELASSKNASIKNIRRAAECYRNLNDYKNAAKYYQLLENTHAATVNDTYYYFQVLKSIGNYTQADEYLQKLKSSPQYALVVQHHENFKNYQNEIKKDSANFKIKDSGINSEESDFSPFINNGDVYFASNRRNVATVNKKFAWDDSYFLDEYHGKFENGTFKDIKALPKTIDSKYHEGPAIVSDDGNTMYITRSNYIDKKLGKDTKRQVNIKLYISRKNEKGEWSPVESFPFNKDDYSIGHPALSKDGQTLYFVSDMPGGYGQTDIYKTRFVNGGWTRPQNLGDKINTEGREMFPYVYADGTLFFSTDGNAGLGGFDVYSTTLEKGNFNAPKNLGYPINTQYDDFGFYLNDDLKTGYISSNRIGGKGSDDIYSFESTTSIIPQYVVKGIVTNKFTKEPLANVSIELYNELKKLVVTVKTDENGFYQLELLPVQVYNLDAEQEGFLKNTLVIKTPNPDSKIINGNIELQPSGIYAMSGLILDSETKLPLNNVAVYIKDKTTGKEILKLLTTENGEFEKMIASVKPGELLNYTIQLQKTGYTTKDVTFTKTIGNPEIIKLNELLDLNLTPIGGSANEFFVMDPIFFDLDKSTIRPDAQLILNKLAETMKQKKDLKIEITSYTDCRATEPYNMDLSQRRACATSNYLVQKGIVKNRLMMKWVGETQLTVNCACEPTNESSCSEEEHQLNRRSNFKALNRKTDQLSSK